MRMICDFGSFGTYLLTPEALDNMLTLFATFEGIKTSYVKGASEPLRTLVQPSGARLSPLASCPILSSSDYAALSAFSQLRNSQPQEV